MSLLLQVMTTGDDEEIKESLHLVLSASKLGLIHESKFQGPAEKGSKASTGQR